MKRNHVLKVYLNLNELETIKKKAEVLGMSPAEFLRVVGLRSMVKIE